MKSAGRRRTKLALRYAAALALLVVFLFPIYWLFMISFKTPAEVFAFPPVWWPARLQFSNYAVLFRDGDVRVIWNSLVIAGASTLLAMLLGSMAAYSLARFRTGGENLAIWIISQRMIPPIAIAFPVFLLFVWLGLVDTYRGLILLYTAFNLPYVIWMMRGYIADVPIELEESGAGRRMHALAGALEGRAADGADRALRHRDLHLRLRVERVPVRSRADPHVGVTFPVQVTHYFGGQSNFWAKISAISVLGTLPIFVVVAIMQRYLGPRHLDGRGQGLMSGLRVTGVHKAYGAVHAVRGIDLDIPAGAFVVLVGPSGCGKTTLLRAIAGLEEIIAGSIALDGREIQDERPRDRNIAMVFQNYALYPFLTVFENIAFGLRARRARRPRSAPGSGARPTCSTYPGCSIAIRASSPAASASGSRSAAPLCATQNSSCSTSRCRTSTPSSATRCGARSSACTSASARP